MGGGAAVAPKKMSNLYNSIHVSLFLFRADGLLQVKTKTAELKVKTSLFVMCSLTF